MSLDKREKPRHRCRIRVKIAAGGRLSMGSVMDISETGARVKTDEVLDIWTGDPIEMRSEELGFLQGKVRWRTPGMVGVQLAASTNTLAKVESLFKLMNA